MSLIDKLQTGKRAFLAGTLAGAITIGLAGGCSRDSNYDNSQVSNTNISTEVYQRDKDKKPENRQEYTFERFVKALGKERVEGIENYEPRIRNFLDKMTGPEAGFFYGVYENPKKFYEELEDTRKEEYKEFNPEKLSPSKLEEYKKQFPWRVIPKDLKFSESDKLLLFMFEELSRPDPENILLKEILKE